jgi:hypothetical protein
MCLHRHTSRQHACAQATVSSHPSVCPVVKPAAGQPLVTTAGVVIAVIQRLVCCCTTFSRLRAPPPLVALGRDAHSVRRRVPPLKSLTSVNPTISVKH